MEAENALVGPQGEPRRLSWRDAAPQVWACCAVHMLAIQVGANMAYSSVLLPQLNDPSSPIKVDLHQASWIASIVTIALPAGSMVAGPLMDRWGRKCLCLLSCAPFVVTWLLVVHAGSVLHLLLARVVFGVFGGFSTVALIYVSEVCHEQFRSMLLGFSSIFVSAGILVTCILGKWLSWRSIAGVYAVIAALNFAALLFIPESPHWHLTLRDDQTKALLCLRKLYKDEKVFLEQKQLFLHHLAAAQPRPAGRSLRQRLSEHLQLYKDPVVYKPLRILCWTLLLQQLSGAYVIIFYAVELFRQLGGDESAAYTALACLGLIRFLFTAISAGLAKRFGRRFLLGASALGMCASMLAAALFQHARPGNGAVALAGVLIYVSFSALGILTIPWTLIGELLPVRVRGKLGGLVVSFAYVFMFLVVKVFPYVTASVDVSLVFAAFGAFNALLFGYLHFQLPETLGKSFVEIEDYFRQEL